jgi:myo-inositol-1-phosphate synthase
MSKTLSGTACATVRSLDGGRGRKLTSRAMAGQGSEGAQPSQERIGLWLVGAGGNVATAVALGLFALQRDLIPPVGIVTALPPFAGLALAPWDAIALGGHEMRSCDLLASARTLASDGVVAADLVEALAAPLAEHSRAVRPGIGPLAARDTDGPRRVAQVQQDLRDFAERTGAAHVVVVNVATTEAPPASSLPGSPEGLRDAIAGGSDVPASVLYAYAALDMGAAYVNFTPSVGSDLAALRALATARGAVHAGNDGKTGETLLKSALAPMYAMRNLKVRSWFGQNILGNEDGRALTETGALASKVRTKSEQLPSILGYAPAAQVGIGYVPPLGDWKVAWEHITFEGFLGARMVTQVLWHGADSSLAAPLVLDLARLVDLAMRRGEVGVLWHLAFFFKSPLGTNEHALHAQLDALLAHLRVG